MSFFDAKFTRTSDGSVKSTVYRNNMCETIISEEGDKNEDEES